MVNDAAIGEPNDGGTARQVDPELSCYTVHTALSTWVGSTHESCSFDELAVAATSLVSSIGH